MTFTLSIEETEGKSRIYGFHLGTIESIARDCAEDILKGHVLYGKPVISVALIRDGKIFDVLYPDGTWHNGTFLQDWLAR